MTLHNNPRPWQPDANGATLVESNDRFLSIRASIGDLVTVLRRPVWHDAYPRYELRFRHGTVQMSHETLSEIVRRGGEALAAQPGEPDVSGSCGEWEAS